MCEGTEMEHASLAEKVEPLLSEILEIVQYKVQRGNRYIFRDNESSSDSEKDGEGQDGDP